ncbi:MAG TPA: methyltransferase, partial [Polyangia bacterium]
MPSLAELIMSGWASHAIHAAVRLGLPDALAAGPADAAALATACDADAVAIGRLARALTTLGLLGEDEEGRFRLTETGARLRRDAPGSLHAWALYWGSLARAFGTMAHAVRTGRPAGIAAPASEAPSVFDAAMAELTRPVCGAIVAACDLGGVSTVVDVGGGAGALLAAILEVHPAVRGILLDLPSAARLAEQTLAARGVAARARCVGGDFFAAVPPGGDLYLLKSVLHDWSDERAAAILGACRGAMAPGARLCVIERLAPARLSTSPRDRSLARADLTLLVTAGGRERTEPELRALLAAAGFTPLRVVAA